MVRRQNPILITPEERTHLESLVKEPSTPALTRAHAQILLMADQHNPARYYTDAEIAEALGVSGRTVARVRAHCRARSGALRTGGAGWRPAPPSHPPRLPATPFPRAGAAGARSGQHPSPCRSAPVEPAPPGETDRGPGQHSVDLPRNRAHDSAPARHHPRDLIIPCSWGGFPHRTRVESGRARGTTG
jgi:DNA-binding CsgD family transcriptional regulator